MAKVFCVEQPKNVSVDAARKFGDIHFAFEPGDRRPSIFGPDFGQHFLDAIEEQGFNVALDYFCVTGSLISICTCLVALLRKYTSIKVLVYVSSDNKYVERIWSVSSLEDLHETGHKQVAQSAG